MNACLQDAAWYARSKAIRTSLARALAKADPLKADVLKAAGLTTRDNRMAERKKPGKHSARRAM